MQRALRAALLGAALLSVPSSWAAGPDAGPAPAADAGRGDASVPDAGPLGPCPDPKVVAGAMEGDFALRDRNECIPEELARLSAAVKMFDQCAGEVRPAKTWTFPVADVPPSEAIGGENGNGFVRNPGIVCYVTPWAGHPAHDLFVDDYRQTSRDKAGNPFHAVAVEEGYVMVARDGWKPGDTSKGGNYVMLYLPGRRQIAYYAHLDAVAVKPGEKVAAGQVLGTIGRTGRNAVPRRSQTHLHFGLWDAERFRPVDSYPLLRSARVVRIKAPSAPPSGSVASP